MKTLSRRRLLRFGGSAAVGSLAGCFGDAHREGTEVPRPDLAKLDSWEPSLTCSTVEKRSGLYESTIEVARVESGISGDHVPIHFADLTPEERDVLREVTERGGYGTCTGEESDAFDRFVGRVRDHFERQKETLVYLEREGWYYGLSVELSDTAVSYPSR